MAALLISTANLVVIVIFRQVNAWTELHPKTQAFLDQTGLHQQQMEGPTQMPTGVQITQRTQPLQMAACRHSVLQTKNAVLQGKSASIINASMDAVLIQPFVIPLQKFVIRTPDVVFKCLVREIKTVAHHQRFAKAHSVYRDVTSLVDFNAQE